MAKLFLSKERWIRLLQEAQIHPNFIEYIGNNEYTGAFTDYSTFSEDDETVKALRMSSMRTSASNVTD